MSAYKLLQFHIGGNKRHTKDNVPEDSDETDYHNKELTDGEEELLYD